MTWINGPFRGHNEDAGQIGGKNDYRLASERLSASKIANNLSQV
jgi:hypothetical protein